jgi:hypothetical protein
VKSLLKDRGLNVSDELHDDIKEIRNLVTQNLIETAAIKATLCPTPGQPSLLDKHGAEIESLKSWRNILNGIWIAITTIASIVFGIHVRGGK